MAKKVTIQDIANALGISRNTVSKAINNSDGIAEATQEMILRKAAEMGYKQFSYIKVLNSQHSLDIKGDETTKRPTEIALFTTMFLANSHFASLMLDKLQLDLSQFGYTMTIHRITPENLAALTLPITFDRARTAAIICVEMFDWHYDEMVCGLGLPTLFVDGPAKLRGRSLPADQLYMENSGEITRLVSDMLAKGVKKIGFVGDYTHCQSFFERYTAFRSAMMIAGVPVEESFIIDTMAQPELRERLAALHELPELFICVNDFAAIDTIRFLRESGRTVPEDVMVCGFDDTAEAGIISPALTTVHIHTQSMAFCAAQLLITRIKEPSLDYRTVYAESELIYRESTIDLTNPD